MKEKLKYILPLLFVFATAIVAEAKIAPNTSIQQLQLQKTVFVSGEKVWLKNSLVSGHYNGHQNILFVDLCGEGSVITSRILLRENNHWQGELTIPDSLETGVYLLRAYTGNYNGKPEITSKLISVINRFGNNNTNETRKLNRNYLAIDQSVMVPENEGKLLKTYADQSKFSPKSKVKFWVEKEGNDYPSGISYSVYKIPDSLGNSTTQNLDDAENRVVYARSDDEKIYNSLIISGKVISKSDSLPVEGEMVLFSVPDSIPQIIYSKTDSKGEFHIHIDECYGSKDAIIQTVSKDRELQITIYPNLLNPPVQIPFYISEATEQSEFVKLAVQRAVLQKVYSFEDKIDSAKKTFKYPFYGKASNVVIPDQYFDLDNFEEISKEILPFSRIRKDKEGYSMRIFNPDKTGFFDNPWILVDGIPVYNIQDLNVLNSRKIKRIETQPELRCYGDLYIESALSIFTYKCQFDEVKMPQNSIRTFVETFSNTSEYVGNKFIESSVMADFRDVLFWEPVLGPFTNAAQVEVQCSYERGSYVAVVQAIDSEGKTLRSVFEFTVE